MNPSRMESRQSKLVPIVRTFSFLAACVVLPHVMNQRADGVTLEDLFFNDQELIVGTRRFSDWELIGIDSTAALPDWSLITVAPFGGTGIQFIPNGQLSVVGFNAIDFSFRYRLSLASVSNAFTGHTLILNGITFSGNGGIGFITDELTAGPGAELESTLAIVDNETDFVQSFDTASFAPKTQIVVTSNAYLSGFTSTDGVNVSSFLHAFDQNGPFALIGDYNQDGTVDAADYVVWRKNAGTTNPLQNDFIGGTIGTSHYNQWRNHFGQSSLGGSAIGSSSHTAVPEPSSLLLLIVASAGLNMRSQCRTIELQDARRCNR